MITVVVIVIVVIVAGGGALLWNQNRHRRLKERFGPEYDRAVERHNSTREAEKELIARQQRHAELDIRPLDTADRDRYRSEWAHVQEHFVDAPETAVTEADRLVTVVMRERGYPTEGFEQQLEHLSVEHGATIGRYRSAHEISDRAATGEASTEDLRQAMVHYRALFDELLGDGARETESEARPEPAEPVQKSEPVEEAEPVGTTEPVAEKEEAEPVTAPAPADEPTARRDRDVTNDDAVKEKDR